MLRSVLHGGHSYIFWFSTATKFCRGSHQHEMSQDTYQYIISQVDLQNVHCWQQRPRFNLLKSAFKRDTMWGWLLIEAYKMIQTKYKFTRGVNIPFQPGLFSLSGKWKQNCFSLSLLLEWSFWYTSLTAVDWFLALLPGIWRSSFANMYPHHGFY